MEPIKLTWLHLSGRLWLHLLVFLLKRNNTVKTNKKRFSRVLRSSLSSLKHNVLKVMSRRDRRIQDPPYRRGRYRTEEEESRVRNLINSYKIGDVTIRSKSHKNAIFRHRLSYLSLPTIFIRPQEAMDKVCSSWATFKGVYS